MNRRFDFILRIVVLFTTLWVSASQPAAAQDRRDPSVAPANDRRAEIPAAQPAPASEPAMGIALPAKADKIADFIPAAAATLTVPARAETLARASLATDQTTAVRFDGSPLAVVVEPDTFAGATELHFRPESMPVTERTDRAAPTAEGRLVDRAGSVTLYRFQIEAVDANGQAHGEFAKPVRMVLDLRAQAADLNPVYTEFYLAYQDETNPNLWHEVPSTLHSADGLISADVRHFSNWAAGVRPQRWNPSWAPAAVSTFSGAATYSYPIEVPPGRAGLQPNVVISYNSRSLDGRIHDDRESGPLGDGWSLAEISVVRVGVKLEFVGGFASNRHPDQFRLVLNGSGHELFPEFPAQTASAAGMRYFVKDAPGIYVKRVYSASAPNADGIYWIVITPDGTRYRLGYTADAEEYQVWNNGYWNIQGHQGHPNNERSALAWHADTVTDSFGNQMQYGYVQWHTDEEIKWYPPGAEHPSVLLLKTWSNRIGSIGYNYPDRVTALPAGDTVARLASTPGSRLVFTTGTQFHYLIDTIYVYHGAAADPIKEYRIALDADIVRGQGCMDKDVQPNVERETHTRLINAISVHSGVDSDPTTADGWGLPATTFTYEPKPHYDNRCFFFSYLAGMQNGYGGSIAFTYASDNRWIGEYAYDGYNRYRWPVLGQSYYVTETRASDGRNPAVKTTYGYQTPCYGQWHWDIPAGAVTCGGADAPDFGTITGFARVTERTFDFDGTTVLNSAQTDFSQTSATTIGRPSIQRRYDGDLATLLSATHTTYATVPLNGLDNMFTYVKEVNTYQYDSGLEMSSKTTYGYDPAKQGGAQYGLLTDTWQYASATAANPYQKDVTYYTPNASILAGGAHWLIAAPTAAGTYDQSGGFLSGSWTYYDGEATNATAPTQGFVTRSRQSQPITCAEIPNPAGIPFPADPNCVHAFQTIDSVSQKDDYGNPTATTTYTGYGYRSLKADFSDSMDWNPTQTGQPNQVQLTRIAYESGYNLYPVKVINALSQETTFETYGFKNAAGVLVPLDGFQEQTGLLKAVIAADATSTRYEYDPFGRLVNTFDDYSAAGFGDASAWNGDPVVRHRYWDNPWNDSAVFLNPTANQPFLISEEKRPGSYANPDPAGGYAFNDQVFFDGFGRTIQSRSIWADVAGENRRQEIYTTTAYDALGRTVCQTTPFNRPFYSDRGLEWPASPFVATACADASMSRTTTAYDAVGRPATVTAPDGSQTRSISRLVNTVTVGGDALFWREQAIDAENHATSRFTNSKGQLALVREHTGAYPALSDYADTQYGYDLLGNLTSVKRRQPSISGNGSDLAPPTTITYDAFGRKTGMVDPDMGSWTYRYNAAGLMIEQRDRREPGPAGDDIVVCFYFDRLNRPTSKSATANGAACPATAVTSGANWLASFAYFSSGAGKLGKPSGTKWNRDGAGAVDTEGFQYDALGRLISHTRTLNGRAYTMQYGGFDALGRATTQTYPDGEVVTVGFDREGENTLHLASAPGNIVANVEYNARSQMTQIDRALGGHDTLYTYYGATGAAGNGNFRLRTIQHASALLPTFQYQYDRVGNITSIADSADGALTTSFTYDALNRLATTNGDYTRSYGYDKLGNLTNNNGVTQTYNGAGSQPHAVRSTGAGATFAYDPAGNMIARSDATGIYAQRFDRENRLVEVEDAAGQTTSFGYDHSGQRTTTRRPDGSVTYDPFPTYEQTVANTIPIDVDSLNAGITCTDYEKTNPSSYGGVGYILYTEEPVGSRFGFAPQFERFNRSDHFICVRYANGAWEYDTDAGFAAFAPLASDLLVATFSYASGGVTAYAGQSGTLNGIHYGYTGSNLAFQRDVFDGAADPGEFQVSGTHFQTFAVSRSTGSLGYGVACQEGATGSGYLLYSAEPVHQRFAANPPHANNAAHFVCVRYTGTTWQYDSDLGYYAFTPRRSDILVAEVNFSQDSVTSLAGQNASVFDVQKGYSSGLSFTANIWNGAANAGEFRISGTSFTPHATQIVAGSAGMGVDCSDGATGTGYLLYSAERVQRRFNGLSPLASAHFVCVRYDSLNKAWQYDTGSTFVNFTPQSSDILVAAVNFDTDQVTSLAGQAGSDREILKGFVSGLSFAADQWGGAANDGEFQVLGATFTPHAVTETSKTYLLGAQPIAVRRTQTAGGTTVATPLRFIYTDHLGSATTLTDGTGTQLLSDMRYLPFGEIRRGTASNWLDRGFTGHQENRDLGLTYMNARFYVPGVGRFASADTIVPDPLKPQAYNRYSYVENNPLTFIDPTGHCSDSYEQGSGLYKECEYYIDRAHQLWQSFGHSEEDWDSFARSLRAGSRENLLGIHDLWFEIYQELYIYDPNDYIDSGLGYSMWVGEGLDPQRGSDCRPCFPPGYKTDPHMYHNGGDWDNDVTVSYGMVNVNSSGEVKACVCTGGEFYMGGGGGFLTGQTISAEGEVEPFVQLSLGFGLAMGWVTPELRNEWGIKPLYATLIVSRPPGSNTVKVDVGWGSGFSTPAIAVDATSTHTVYGPQ